MHQVYHKNVRQKVNDQRAWNIACGQLFHIGLSWVFSGPALGLKGTINSIQLSFLKVLQYMSRKAAQIFSDTLISHVQT